MGIKEAEVVFRLATKRQRELTEAFAKIGVNFMHLDPTINMHLVKEAMQSNTAVVVAKYTPILQSIVAIEGPVVTPEFNRRLELYFSQIQASIDEPVESNREAVANSDEQNTYLMIREALAEKHPQMENADADRLARELLAEKKAQLEGAELVLKIIIFMGVVIVFSMCFWLFEIGLLLSIGAAILTVPAIMLAGLPMGYVLGKRAHQRFLARINDSA